MGAVAGNLELTHPDRSTPAPIFEASAIPWDELAFRSTHDALTEYLKRTEA